MLKCQHGQHFFRAAHDWLKKITIGQNYSTNRCFGDD